MERKKIVFTAPKTAQLQEADMPTLKNDDDVLVKMIYTVVSGGTEKACLMAEKNTSQHFPMALGYCGVGIVEDCGKDVKKLAAGDRVLVYHGCHSNYNVRRQEDIIKVGNADVDSLEAAFVIIAAMGLGGVRKLEIEIGEPAMVIGLGLLGMFSVQFSRLNGAYPVIALDFNEERRQLALRLGADCAFDPHDPELVSKIKAVTGGKGISACVEVTGNARALVTALDCAAPMGRISLLGCTRNADVPIDFYTQVHRPGIRLIGAHNFVRPKTESYPHHWTNADDCHAILDLIAAKRIQVSPMVSRIVDPSAAPEIFRQLCEDPLFPLGTVFDWSKY